MQDDLAPFAQQLCGDMSVKIASQQHGLKENETSVPHRGSAPQKVAGPSWRP